METTHRIVVGDSGDLAAVDDGEVDLVVTSPPYPMIEMWDGLFSAANPEIGECLDGGRGRDAFELMHEELAATWAEVERVLADGGIACVNVGDATRTVDDTFECYRNHVAVTDWFTSNGFRSLPDAVWRKPANSAAKFMGSGMLPPNAYVTLEHEHVLVFRKNGPRRFAPGEERRYESAYFWEERNRWFSDLWEDIRGERQVLGDDDLRERSGAFPFSLPYRLINMYSVYGDTVLDPFWGTGTTTLAAMVAGRDSIGYEIEEEFAALFERRVDDVAALSRTVVRDRLEDHREFVEACRADGDALQYEASNYDVPVRTRQERDIQFYVVEDVDERDSTYTLVHSAFDGRDDSGIDGEDDSGIDARD